MDVWPSIQEQLRCRGMPFTRRPEEGCVPILHHTEQNLRHWKSTINFPPTKSKLAGIINIQLNKVISGIRFLYNSKWVYQSPITSTMTVSTSKHCWKARKISRWDRYSRSQSLDNKLQIVQNYFVATDKTTPFLSLEWRCSSPNVVVSWKRVKCQDT